MNHTDGILYRWGEKKRQRYHPCEYCGYELVEGEKLLLETYVTTLFHINHYLWHTQERDYTVSSLFYSDFMQEKALSLFELHFCAT